MLDPYPACRVLHGDEMEVSSVLPPLGRRYMEMIEGLGRQVMLSTPNQMILHAMDSGTEGDSCSYRDYRKVCLPSFLSQGLIL